MNSFFTRIFAILLGLIAMFTGGNLDNVEIKITNEITTETTEIDVEIFNYTGKTISTDKYFILEKNNSGVWNNIEMIILAEEIAVLVRNFQTISLTINVAKVYGISLESGTYRLSKVYNGGHSRSVEFEVTQA